MRDHVGSPLTRNGRPAVRVPSFRPRRSLCPPAALPIRSAVSALANSRVQLAVNDERAKAEDTRRAKGEIGAAAGSDRDLRTAMRTSFLMATALPGPLQFVADLLRNDGARATGRAVLLASAVGLDVFEARIADLAATTGIGTQRLQEIVDVGRQAHSGTSPLVHEQHLVSKVILRQFCVPTPHGDRLLSHSLQYGKVQQKGPGGVGKQVDFVKIDSQETERVWGVTEQELPGALAAARTRRVFNNPKHVAAIKGAIALHFARSRDLLELDKTIQQGLLAKQREAFLADPQMMDALFYLKHKLYPPNSERARAIIADDLLSTTKSWFANGLAFRLRVIDMFHGAQDMAASLGLQIMSPQRGEFLIGDVPAIPIDLGRGSHGLLGGVAFGDATMIILPLGPKRLAALSRAPNGFARVSGTFVRELNRFEVSNAKEYVFMRPGSGLESFVLAERPPTGTVRP